jgi:isopentenyl-diphosphate delta-isomerase
MEDELIDIYDESNNLTHVQKTKSEAHKYGLWHRSAHVWIYNSKGEVLLQLRAKHKPVYPDKWDISSAGHVIPGEDPLAAALRETEEEIGLELKKKDLDFFGIKKASEAHGKIRNNEFYYIYFLKYDGIAKNLKLQSGELQEVRFLPINKLEGELRTNPNKYTPHGDYWFEIMDEVKRRLKI